MVTATEPRPPGPLPEGPPQWPAHLLPASQLSERTKDEYWHNAGCRLLNMALKSGDILYNPGSKDQQVASPTLVQRAFDATYGRGSAANGYTRAARPMFADEGVKNPGVSWSEADTTMRGRTAEARDLGGGVDGIAAVVEDGVVHGRAGIFGRIPAALETLWPEGAARCCIATSPGRDRPYVGQLAIHVDVHGLRGRADASTYVRLSGRCRESARHGDDGGNHTLITHMLDSLAIGRARRRSPRRACRCGDDSHSVRDFRQAWTI